MLYAEHFVRGRSEEGVGRGQVRDVTAGLGGFAVEEVEDVVFVFLGPDLKERGFGRDGFVSVVFDFTLRCGSADVLKEIKKCRFWGAGDSVLTERLVKFIIKGMFPAVYDGGGIEF